MLYLTLPAVGVRYEAVNGAAQKEDRMRCDLRRGHNGRCPCGVVTPCEELVCDERPGHEYPCPECLRREGSPRFADELSDDVN
jgi:hypothetical protein